MKTKQGWIILALLAGLVTGCSLFVPSEGLQGGSNVAYEHREWHPNGKPKSHCVVNRDSLTNLPQGASVQVGEGCAVTFIAPEIVQGDASITAGQLERYQFLEGIATQAFIRAMGSDGEP